MDKERPVTTSLRNIFRRIQRYGHRKFPSLIPYPGTKEILSWHLEKDEEENAKTEPPSDELIDLRCIWAVEFYTPSQVTQLLHSFEALGWDKEDPIITRLSPTDWIRRFRETPQSGGLFNLGPIHRRDDRRFFHSGRTAQIPPHVDYALAAMYGLTSSITCIVICFILNDESSRLFDETLRRKYKTVLEPIATGGHRVLDPRWKKKAAIQAIRAEMRESAANWFRTQLPGLFTRNIIEDEFPTCEFVTLRKTQPFPKQDERDNEAKAWLSLLDMDNDWDAWVADAPPGLKFAWPLLRDEKNRFHAVIAAREDAFLNEDLRAYGGDNRNSYVLYVDSCVSRLLSCWALLCALSGFERRLNNLRDSSTFKPAQLEKPLPLLRELIGHVSQSVDIATVSTELKHFAGQNLFFDRDIGIYRPSNPSFYHDKDITLSSVLRENIEERSIRLEILDRSIRDLLIQYGGVIGTHENINLQKRMSNLTRAMLILTIIVTGLTMVSVYISIKTDNIAWPWLLIIKEIKKLFQF